MTKFRFCALTENFDFLNCKPVKNPIENSLIFFLEEDKSDNHLAEFDYLHLNNHLNQCLVEWEKRGKYGHFNCKTCLINKQNTQCTFRYDCLLIVNYENINCLTFY